MKIIYLLLLVMSVNVASAAETGLQTGLAEPYAAPEFSGISTWINSPPLTMQSLKGKVVLVDFWTYSCINCVRTLPYIIEWDRKYRDKGLVIIGVSAPEFEFEKNPENVRQAVAKYHINYPVALDNNLATWSNFRNHYWPAHYLINREGQVVATHFGEGEYDVTEQNIRYLLGLGAEAGEHPAASDVDDNQTPETYLGSYRSARFAGKDITSPLPLHEWALAGNWVINTQNIVSGDSNARVRFHFKSQKVFLVLGSATGKPIKVSLLLNGKPLGDLAGKDVKDSTLIVDQHTLYELVNQKTSREGELEITAHEVGLEAYAFTYGF